MMTISYIYSRRKLGLDPSWQIVYEWEDIISKRLGIPIRTFSIFKNKYRYRLFDKLHLSTVGRCLSFSKKKFLFFTSIVDTKPQSVVNNNTILAIIDFWLTDDQIPLFFKSYKDVPLMLLTNREVYDKFREFNCPIPIEHWPLSLPDNNSFINKKKIEKSVEFCTFGRVNPFFIRMLDRYCMSHPDFCYVYSKGKSSDRSYYTNRGNFVAKDTGRESYLEFMRQTKITCYSTPGIDESKRETDRYNQVTPRVLEMLSNGCQVIGHFPQSADVVWYNLNSVVPNVNTYEEFEQCLDDMRNTQIDVKKVQNFLSKHYTSVRVNMLEIILKKHNLPKR